MPAPELVALFRPVAEKNVLLYCDPQNVLYRSFVEDAAQRFAAGFETVLPNGRGPESALAFAQKAVEGGYFDLNRSSLNHRPN